MGVLPQVSNQIINVPSEKITDRHCGFIVSEMVFRWEIQGAG